jgi:O-antigen ligase
MWAPFLAIGIATIFTAPEPTVAVRFFLVQLSYCAMFAIPFSIIKAEEDLVEYLILIVLSSILPCLYAFYQLLTGQGVTEEEGLRLEGTFGHPNIFAFYLALQITMVLYLFKSGAVRIPNNIKQLLSAYLPVLLILLSLTKTRSAWIACALIFLIYGIRLDRRYLIYLVTISIAFLLVPSLSERLSDLGEGNINEDYARLNSFAWRKLLWQAALEWVARRPILGHGLESFKFYLDRFFPLPLEEGTSFDAHNVYIQVLFETGAIGLLSFIWIFVVLSIRLLRGYRLDKPGLTIILTLVIIYLLVCYSDNMQYYLAFNWYFWFTIGSVCAWARLRSGRQNSVGQQICRRTT